MIDPAEYVHWGIGIGLSGVVAYYTAQGAMRERIARLEATQRAEAKGVQQSIADLRAEMNQRLGDLRDDIRELREALR